MSHKIFLAIAFLLPTVSFAQTEWVLQPWVQVIGQLGEQLGSQVTSVTPRPNLPYKALIAKNGGFGFYTLESQADTLPKRVYSIRGDSFLTGDLNDDGYTDVVLPHYDSGYDTVFVFWGHSTGVDTLNPLIIPNENRYDGLTKGCIGDVNNDGKSDLILIAPGFSKERGKVYVFLGPNITANANAVLVGDTEFIQLGVRVSVGDLNGDGLKDLIVRGNENLQNQPDSTRHDYINVYWGTSFNQLNLSLGFRIEGTRNTPRGLAIFDVNGDVVDDLLWTNYDTIEKTQVILVHYGRKNSKDFKTTPDLLLRSPPFASFDYNIINGGDLNDDGYNDVVIGAGGFQNVFHYVLVYSGGPDMDGKFDAAVGTDNASYFGQAIAAVGDVSGDGLADILVGAPRYGRFGLNENKGYWGVFLGDRRIPTSSTPEPPIKPSAYKLNQNFPNPFNSTTVITYSLPVQSQVRLRLFDILGKEIGTVLEGERSAGEYYLPLDLQSLPSGVYIYQLHAIGSTGSVFTESKKMILVR